MSLKILLNARIKIECSIPSSTRNLKYLNNNRQLRIFKNGHLHQHFKRSIASQIPLLFGNNFIYYKKKQKKLGQCETTKELKCRID